MAASWQLFFLLLFFFTIALKPGVYNTFRGLRVYCHCPFSCKTEKEATAAIFILSILITRSYF